MTDSSKNRETIKRFLDIVSGKRKGIFASLARLVLFCGTIPYGFATWWKKRKFDRNDKFAFRSKAKVISIGNLTTGGTGKTPMVEWVCRHLRNEKIGDSSPRVCIISRGYGAEKGSVNDEARELEMRLPDVPHLQNPDRIAAAKVATVELDSQIIVLDDAFQHRRIARDMDIVLIDATNPFGFGYQLPRGLLRESISGLNRAHAAILTRCDLVPAFEVDRIKSEVLKINPRIVCAESMHAPMSLRNASGEQKPVSEISESSVFAFCGIGNPVGFWHSLQGIGANIVLFEEFPDHHIYTRDDINRLKELTKSVSEIEAVVCTSKDLVKIGIDKFEDVNVYALEIKIRFLNGESEIRDLLAKHALPHSSR